jgi:hypothetical protein
MATINDVKRQRRAAGGKLFDLRGGSSMGSLSRGELRLKGDPSVLSSPVRQLQFEIGTEQRLAPGQYFPLGDHEKRRDQFFKQLEERAAIDKVPPEASPRLVPNSAVDKARSASASTGVSTEPFRELTSGQFLNQGTLNPVKVVNIGGSKVQ